jgi:hypothetical protein
MWARGSDLFSSRFVARCIHVSWRLYLRVDPFALPLAQAKDSVKKALAFNGSAFKGRELRVTRATAQHKGSGKGSNSAKGGSANGAGAAGCVSFSCRVSRQPCSHSPSLLFARHSNRPDGKVFAN